MPETTKWAKFFNGHALGVLQMQSKCREAREQSVKEKIRKHIMVIRENALCYSHQFLWLHYSVAQRVGASVLPAFVWISP